MLQLRARLSYSNFNPHLLITIEREGLSPLLNFKQKATMAAKKNCR